MAKGAHDLAHDLAQALHAATDSPPWEVQWQAGIITPEQYADLVMSTARSEPSTCWRVEALKRLLEVSDDAAERKSLSHEIEDELLAQGRAPFPYHWCDPKRCDCVPPRRRTPLTPRR